MQENKILPESSALDFLKKAGIPISSSGNCGDRSNPKCTSVEGIRHKTVMGLVDLKQASGCQIVLTGGTEVGHSTTSEFSHYNGYKADIRLNDCINNFIRGEFPFLTTRSDGAKLYRDPGSGALYAHEGNHWDILFC